MTMTMTMTITTKNGKKEDFHPFFSTIFFEKLLSVFKFLKDSIRQMMFEVSDVLFLTVDVYQLLHLNNPIVFRRYMYLNILFRSGKISFYFHIVFLLYHRIVYCFVGVGVATLSSTL